MKQLLILRHAKAESTGDAPDDHARTLDARGREDAAQLGVWLRAENLLPDHVLCSSAARTRETLAALTITAPTEFSDNLYMASASDLMSAIHTAPTAANRLLLVTHNAGAHELVVTLTHDASDEDFDKLRQKFPPCALAVLRVENDWSSLKPHSATLTHLRYPS